MREKVTADRMQEFMKALGRASAEPTPVFFVGGTTAVLCGWRESTIDIDLKIIPERDEILRRIPDLKEGLDVNVELASPEDFIPPLPSWEERSRFIQQEGRVTFLHYDFYAQALAKIERGHKTDLQDVEAMLDNGLIEPSRLLSLFKDIEPLLYKYPAINASEFRTAVERAVHQSGG